MDCHVGCFVESIEKENVFCADAARMIEKVIASGKKEGVIWIEFYESMGGAEAQIHLIPTEQADQLPPPPVNLAQRA